MEVDLDFLTLKTSLLTMSLKIKSQSTGHSPSSTPNIIFSTVMVTHVGFSRYKIGTKIPKSYATRHLHNLPPDNHLLDSKHWRTYPQST